MKRRGRRKGREKGRAITGSNESSALDVGSDWDTCAHGLPLGECSRCMEEFCASWVQQDDLASSFPTPSLVGGGSTSDARFSTHHNREYTLPSPPSQDKPRTESSDDRARPPPVVEGFRKVRLTRRVEKAGCVNSLETMKLSLQGQGDDWFINSLLEEKIVSRHGVSVSQKNRVLEKYVISDTQYPAVKEHLMEKELPHLDGGKKEIIWPKGAPSIMLVRVNLGKMKLDEHPLIDGEEEPETPSEGQATLDARAGEGAATEPHAKKPRGGNSAVAELKEIASVLHDKEAQLAALKKHLTKCSQAFRSKDEYQAWLTKLEPHMQKKWFYGLLTPEQSEKAADALRKATGQKSFFCRLSWNCPGNLTCVKRGDDGVVQEKRIGGAELEGFFQSLDDANGFPRRESTVFPYDDDQDE